MDESLWADAANAPGAVEEVLEVARRNAASWSKVIVIFKEPKTSESMYVGWITQEHFDNNELVGILAEVQFRLMQAQAVGGIEPVE